MNPILRTYLANRKGARWSVDNIYGAARILERLQGHLAGEALDLIAGGTVHLQEFLNAGLDAGLSPNTVIVHYRQLKAFYRWATKVGYVDPDPMTGIEIPKPADPDPDRMPVIGEADYRAMLASCRAAAKPAGRGTKTVNDRRDAAIIALLWSTGIRRGELAGLEYRDIDWDEMTAYLRKTKGRGKTNSRTVTFDEEALHYLNLHMLGRGNEPGPLFHSTRGTPIKPQTITLMLRRRGAQAGIDPDVAGSAHAFRRRFTNDWLTHGGELASLETVMGWKHDGRMAAHYARESESVRATSEARRIAEARRGGHLRAVEG